MLNRAASLRRLPARAGQVARARTSLAASSGEARVASTAVKPEIGSITWRMPAFAPRPARSSLATPVRQFAAGAAAAPAPKGIEAFFKPRTVALIGATEKAGSVGRTILENLIDGNFKGRVYPVNDKRDTLLGKKAYPSIASIPEQVDLAVITTPASAVPAIMKQLADAKVPACVIISAGFLEAQAKETGDKLLADTLAEARRGGVRVIGPNCLGVMAPEIGLNATFGGHMPPHGALALVSQSGALVTSVMDWSRRSGLGFSSVASLGSMVDVSWGDLLRYYANDPATKAIACYVESVGDARAFLSAAAEVAPRKPIVVIKAGRTEEAARAAASHTGTLTGADAAVDEALRRAGVLRVDRIDELLDVSRALAAQPLPQGPALAVLTNAGGPGILATDALVNGAGGARLAELSPATHAALNAFLPGAWSHANPVDIIGDAGADLYARAFEACAAEPAADGILVVLTPQAMTECTKTAEALRAVPGKTVLASFMGGPATAEAEEVLRAKGIPNLAAADHAARVFRYMAQCREMLDTMAKAKADLAFANYRPDEGRRRRAAAVLEAVRAEGRTTLTEFESKSVLAEYGIPVVRTFVCTSADEAARRTDECGYPAVVKLHSETITHKSDVGGVKLGMKSAAEVRAAFDEIKANVAAKAGPEHFLGVSVYKMVDFKETYEVILGASVDPQLGPVLVFGTGGQLVEVYRDTAVALPPLTPALAGRLIHRTRIGEVLKGVRGRPAIDESGLQAVLVAFARLVSEQPLIAEVDINPLLLSHKEMIAVDARVIVHPRDVDPASLPRPALLAPDQL
eukprot:tig00000718_g3725.t1